MNNLVSFLGKDAYLDGSGYASPYTLYTNADIVYINSNGSFFMQDYSGPVINLSRTKLNADQVLNAYSMFSNSNVGGKALCGLNTTTLAYTYNNAAVSEASCGESVINMYYAYNNCQNLKKAVCGNNVLSMYSAYNNCQKLTEAACGDNVVDMYYAYNNCISLENAACGPNVRFMNYTYTNCFNLKTPVCGDNVMFMYNTYVNCCNLEGDPAVGNNVNYLYCTYCNCPNIYGDMWLRYGGSSIYMYNCFNNRNTSRSLNIHVRPESIWQDMILHSYSALDGSKSAQFEPLEDGNGYYSAPLNIYLLNNFYD